MVSPFSVERAWNQLFLHLIKRISTSARSHCYRNSRRVPVLSCLSERMCERWRMFAAAAGTMEGELRSSDPGCVGCCSKPQTAKKFQAFPPLPGPHPFNGFFSFPLSASDFSPSPVFPSFPPAEALLGRALEQERESGSVGQLRQLAQAGCSHCGTRALFPLPRTPAYSS